MSGFFPSHFFPDLALALSIVRYDPVAGPAVGGTAVGVDQGARGKARIQVGHSPCNPVDVERPPG